MSRYPIPVDDLSGDKALTVVCLTCRTEAVIDADHIYNEGLYRCPKDCGGTAVYKYESGRRCQGCGELGFFDPDPLNGCCSRKCMLQAEYAESLKGTAA